MSDTRDLIRRLEARHGEAVAERRVEDRAPDEIRQSLRRLSPGSEAILYRRDLPRLATNPLPASPRTGEAVVLEDAVAGCEISLPEYGKAYQIETPLSSFGKQRAALGDEFCRALQAQDSSLQRRVGRNCGIDAVQPKEMVFFDIETTGLANAPLFLIGMLYWEDGEFIARQYLARHYGEEAAVTSLFVRQALCRRMLVSFNGKSFDLPTLRVRAAANGVPWPTPEPAHFDLLHESRRIWRSVLPNCKLQTLEQHVCGRPPRCGDIPGCEIPAAYHNYVHTADAGQLVQIVKHNLLDLVTLAELMVRLPGEE